MRFIGLNHKIELWAPHNLEKPKLSQDEFDTHDYINNLKELRSHNFDELYAQYAEKYAV